MNKIKIIFFSKNLAIGGTEKSALLCARGLNKKEFDVFVITHVQGDKTRFNEFQSCFGNKLITINRNNELQNIIDDIKPDIFQVYRSGFDEFPEPGRDISVNRFCEVNVFGHIDPNPKVNKTLFMSKWLMNDSAKKYGLDLTNPRWDYLNNPIDSPYADAKFDLEISPDITVLGRCGRDSNGIYDDIGIKAMHILALTGHKIHFLVVSPPLNMIQDLKDFGIPYTVIEPTINPVELSKFYNTIDIYCHARADGETFGSNIGEAQIHSKPVVTHIATPKNLNMGVFQAQIELISNGITGYVVEHEPKLYADAVSKLINNIALRNKMGRAGYTKAMSNYHTPIVVAKLERIYKELIS